MFRILIIAVYFILPTIVQCESFWIKEPIDNSLWRKDQMYKISWSYTGLGGDVEIMYSNSGKQYTWTSWKKIPIYEEYVNFNIGILPTTYKNSFHIRVVPLNEPALAKEVEIRLPPPPSTTINTQSNRLKNYFYSTKYDNIRSGPGSSYSIKAHCKKDHYYEIINREGRWYKIRYNFRNQSGKVYIGYIHDGNGYSVKKKASESNVYNSYAKQYSSNFQNSKQSYNDYSNYFILGSGSLFLGFNFVPNITYGHLLSGPLVKAGGLLLGLGSIANDYTSSYRIGFTSSDVDLGDDELYGFYYLIWEDFRSKSGISSHVIDMGIVEYFGAGEINIGYRHQFQDGKIFDHVINSNLSGFHFDFGLHIGGIW